MSIHLSHFDERVSHIHLPFSNSFYPSSSLMIDANREIKEAAQEHPIAEAAWGKFHNFTYDAQVLLKDHFGSTTEEYLDDEGDTRSRTGARAALFDIHGYVGSD